MTTKWDCRTTTAFVQEYKARECLWNFKLPEYKNKRMREVAYREIAAAMAIDGFGVPEVKAKIKNIRSTFAQEMKKMYESRKTSNGTHRSYESNIQWLKELEPIYKDTDLRRTLDNMELNSQIESVSTETPSYSKQIRSRPKKRANTVFHAMTDLKPLHRSINNSRPNEDSFDVFGKSVAMQLKNFSHETALRAQCLIQNILTELGIEELTSQKCSAASTPSSLMGSSSVLSGFDTNYISDGSGRSFSPTHNQNQVAIDTYSSAAEK